MKDERIILSVHVHVWHRDCKQNVYSQVTNSLWMVVNPVSGIFKSIQNKVLFRSFNQINLIPKLYASLFFASNILENIAAYKQN